MKFILRPIWNYVIGYRNGYYPKILWEHIPQCPLKFWSKRETHFKNPLLA